MFQKNSKRDYFSEKAIETTNSVIWLLIFISCFVLLVLKPSLEKYQVFEIVSKYTINGLLALWVFYNILCAIVVFVRLMQNFSLKLLIANGMGFSFLLWITFMLSYNYQRELTQRHIWLNLY
jgi:hypothetical protein